VKNAVYALPVAAPAQEDFEWALKEITEAGGEGMILEARLIDGLLDAELRAMFNTAREVDYRALAKELRAAWLHRECRTRSGSNAAPGCSTICTRISADGGPDGSASSHWTRAGMRWTCDRVHIPQ
jgi:hypothetical protein